MRGFPSHGGAYAAIFYSHSADRVALCVAHSAENKTVVILLVAYTASVVQRFMACASEVEIRPIFLVKSRRVQSDARVGTLLCHRSGTGSSR